MSKRKTNRKTKNTIIFIAVTLFIILVACVSLARENNEEAEPQTPVTQTESRGSTGQYVTSSMEIPACPATITQSNGNDHEVHTYNGFTLCYRENYEVAEWVAYLLTKEELNTVIGRTDDFRADTKISTGSASLADYKASGFDRGHLAPAADMEWSEESCRDSFLLSNMTPQAPQFNRGLWKTLEEAVRDWAAEFGEVYVVTGPVLEKEASDYPSIGENKVCVPDYFYKVLLARYNDGNDDTTIGIGFILPNQKCPGTIWDYAVSIDEVEQRTGLDFFTMLNDSIEEKLESAVDVSLWK